MCSVLFFCYCKIWKPLFWFWFGLGFFVFFFQSNLSFDTIGYVVIGQIVKYEVFGWIEQFIAIPKILKVQNKN